eukprot:UN24918
MLKRQRILVFQELFLRWTKMRLILKFTSKVQEYSIQRFSKIIAICLCCCKKMNSKSIFVTKNENVCRCNLTFQCIENE